MVPLKLRLTFFYFKKDPDFRNVKMWEKMCIIDSLDNSI